MSLTRRLERARGDGVHQPQPVCFQYVCVWCTCSCTRGDGVKMWILLFFHSFYLMPGCTWGRISCTNIYRSRTADEFWNLNHMTTICYLQCSVAVLVEGECCKSTKTKGRSVGTNGKIALFLFLLLSSFIFLVIKFQVTLDKGFLSRAISININLHSECDNIMAAEVSSGEKSQFWLFKSHISAVLMDNDRKSQNKQLTSNLKN